MLISRRRVPVAKGKVWGINCSAQVAAGVNARVRVVTGTVLDTVLEAVSDTASDTVLDAGGGDDTVPAGWQAGLKISSMKRKRRKNL